MKSILIALLLFTGSSAFAQVNYVLNPDFETHSFCPGNNDEIKAATYWSGVDTLGKTFCIPDYCHTCATGITTLTSVPDNYSQWQYPHSGNGMARVLMFYYDSSMPKSVYNRDYLQGRLFKKLTPGKTYCVSFYVNLVEASNYAIQEIGAYLDNGSIDTTYTCSLAQTKYAPQVVNNSSIITDTANWIKIQGSFISSGNEQFITIGNFKDSAYTTKTRVPTSQILKYIMVSAYLIDDVSVIESDLKADAGADRHIGRGDSTYIGRPNEIGLECTWSMLGSTTIIGTGAGLWVKPNVTTSYVVTQTLCGQVKKDTVEVAVWGVGVGSINGRSGQGYTLSPNPNNGAFEITQSFANEETLSVEIHNAIGQRIHSASAHFSHGKALLDVREHLQPGIYFLLLKDAAGNVYTMRFVKE